MSSNEVVAYIAAILTPFGAALAFILNWYLQKGKQEADLKLALDAQTAQIESSIAEKYSDRITALEAQVKELFSSLVEKAGEVGELRGQVSLLREQLAVATADKAAVHLELATLRAKVSDIRATNA